MPHTAEPLAWRSTNYAINIFKAKLFLQPIAIRLFNIRLPMLMSRKIHLMHMHSIFIPIHGTN